jgi:hypothetical protein
LHLAAQTVRRVDFNRIFDCGGARQNAGMHLISGYRLANLMGDKFRFDARIDRDTLLPNRDGAVHDDRVL